MTQCRRYPFCCKDLCLYDLGINGGKKVIIQPLGLLLLEDFQNIQLEDHIFSTSEGRK